MTHILNVLYIVMGGALQYLRLRYCRIIVASIVVRVTVLFSCLSWRTIICNL